MTCEIVEGDCIEAMRALEPNSVDAIVCDPPYEMIEPTRLPDVDLYVGDVRTVLAALPERSVHCVVTSQPYSEIALSRLMKGAP